MNCPLPTNQLNLDKACITCLSASCGQFQQSTSTNSCVSGTLQASQVWGAQGYFNSLCSTNANFTNACISNLTLANFTPSTNYRATVNYSNNAVYALGSQLNFTNIVDDPNNNVLLTPATSYTAPVTGYYDFTFKVNITAVNPSNGPILGSPVANPQIFVNGIPVREIYAPFISFFNSQNVILDSLITLQKGDIVTMAYNVLAGAGTPVVGTVNIIGTGIEDGNSFFKIVLISAMGASGGQPTCPPCPNVVISCATNTPMTNPCSTC
jgi:hypothetical protein